MAKTIHHYHPETFDYLGDGEADLSPLEKGVWLIPAHATDVPLIKYDPEKEVLRFDRGGERWLKVNVEKVRRDAAVASAKAARNDILASVVDRLNPAYWESVSKAKREEWKKYRQDLIDIDKQAGFPLDIEWPAKPEM